MSKRLVSLSDRALIRVAGEGAAKFLQGLCSQDVPAISQSVSRAAPAAFLSPKGRVLCDAIVVARSEGEYLLDCHNAVAKSLQRLLVRHRLREPLKIDDVSAAYRVVAQLPPGAIAEIGADDVDVDLANSFFEDPRYAAVGRRCIVEAETADSLLSAGRPLTDYHTWRVLCAVPEGPSDLPVDTVMPLHANLDLLNFVSFSKGCYVGQELTARTKHRGAVRRRIFSAVASTDPENLISSLSLAPSEPLPRHILDAGHVLPGVRVAGGPEGDEPSEETRSLLAMRPNADKTTPAGVLYSTAENVGLCLLRCDGQFNDRENFKDREALKPGTQVKTIGGMAVAIRAPPYAFE